MKEYRFSIREKNYTTFTEYHATMKKCMDTLKKELSSMCYYLYKENIVSIMIDTLEDNIITNVKMLKGEEFIIS